MNKIVYGADTETMEGAPITFQFYSADEDHECADVIFLDDPEEALSTLIRWCAQREAKKIHVVYVHNLDFDAISFFWTDDRRYHRELSLDGEFKFSATVDRRKWTIRGVYGEPTFFSVSDGHKINVTFVDSFSWFKASLARAASLFCPNLPKLQRPAGLGKRRFDRTDREFCKYALRDAEVAYHMGLAIEALHQEFDVRQCVSIPDTGARIFRHRYVRESIPLPSKEIITASMFAYHGGKNNFTGKPGWYRGVTALDISSAYPHAMSQLPHFTQADAYRTLKFGSRTKKVPLLGVYYVQGEVADCAWPILYSHSFKPLTGCLIENLWVTGFELQEALDSDEFRMRSALGYVYDVDREKTRGASSFARYVADFYALKESEPDRVKRALYKLLLNSLYGKFIQTRKRGSQDVMDEWDNVTSTDVEIVAGGLFHPFIAALITGHTRAAIHRLEHEYKAVHTSTDGILTLAKIDAQQFGKPKLGGLTIEAQGDAIILRNKLYILYSDEGDEADASNVFKGKFIAKYALHGFQGTVFELEKMIVSGRRKYSREKPNRLKESIRRKLVPNQFVSRPYTLKVGELPIRA